MSYLKIYKWKDFEIRNGIRVHKFTKYKKILF